jgi:hypothetical protein
MLFFSPTGGGGENGGSGKAGGDSGDGGNAGGGGKAGGCEGGRQQKTIFTSGCEQFAARWRSSKQSPSNMFPP